MKIEELKSITTSGEMGEVLSNLAPEILALVEAANKMRGQSNEVTDEIVWLEEATESFNAKLESL